MMMMMMMNVFFQFFWLMVSDLKDLAQRCSLRNGYCGTVIETS